MFLIQFFYSISHGLFVLCYMDCQKKKVFST